MRQILITWFYKRRSSIVKYSIVIFCVVILAILMHTSIGESRGFLATILVNIEGISIFTALVIYILEGSERKQKKHYEAWQIIKTVQGTNDNYATIKALQDLNAEGVILSEAGAVLELSGANLAKVMLNGAVLMYANLEQAYLDSVKLRGAKLWRTNFSSACLDDADLSSSFLQEANLSNAQLLQANLEEACLHKANLEGAYLGKANLRKADLREANLKKAELHEANLEDANLEGAILPDGTKYQSKEQLKKFL
ncbi:MAG: pentapeptide repeat-containing protein [Symplocastrum torsivum CPER-KK1]|uniref:Pentapeptide repeat-containing protein n=1 Tax=Symplocastrum torsivum CPER-KK1 TaxID=450513 RepID=A0A951PT73_9CYAN|nr:pentapeptide repeat-containing protein [Symplocastrum torsivum CPER-KK1]